MHVKSMSIPLYDAIIHVYSYYEIFQNVFLASAYDNYSLVRVSTKYQERNNLFSLILSTILLRNQILQ